MKKSRLIILILTIMTTIVSLTGCGGIKRLEDIKVTSAKISSIVPDGFRSMSLGLDAGVSNPGVQVSFSDISLSLKHSGKILGNVAVDPFVLMAESENVYHLRADVMLGEGVTLLELGRLLDRKALDEALVDISAKVKLKGGLSKKVRLDDIPLKKLLETAR